MSDILERIADEARIWNPSPLTDLLRDVDREITALRQQLTEALALLRDVRIHIERASKPNTFDPFDKSWCVAGMYLARLDALLKDAK